MNIFRNLSDFFKTNFVIHLANKKNSPFSHITILHGPRWPQ